MEFDKSKVFTAVNADELKIGSKVILADDFGGLKKAIEADEEVITLKEVLDENKMLRFKAPKGVEYALAYLIEPPEEKKLKVSDLKIGDIVRHKSRNLEYLVTGIDYDEEQVLFNDIWFDDDGDLGDWWEKVEND